MVIQAPYPNVTSLIIVPDPDMGDTEQLASTVVAKQMMDGTMSTIVKRQTTKRIYTFVFDLTRIKMLEMKEFVRNYAGHKWHLTWSKGTIIGRLMVNPLELEAARRTWVEIDNVESGTLQLTFETE